MIHHFTVHNTIFTGTIGTSTAILYHYYNHPNYNSETNYIVYMHLQMSLFEVIIYDLSQNHDTSQPFVIRDMTTAVFA